MKMNSFQNRWYMASVQVLARKCKALAKSTKNSVRPRLQGVPYVFADFSSLKDFKSGPKHMVHPVDFH